MNRGPAITATILALALINVGAATLIVGAMGQRSFAPGWVGVAVLVAGIAVAVWAFTLWRGYLQGIRER